MLQRLSLLFLLIVGSAHFAFAQPRRSGGDPEIRKLKIDYVTGQMKLAPAQMQKFVPLYDQYSGELFQYRRAIRELDRNPNKDFSVEQRQKLEQQIVTIKGAYKNRFLAIITPEQLAAMYKAEGEFKSILLENLKNRKR
ncbi:MAG: hypothetical protein QM642_09895 [Edaphocola sp.]